MTDTLDAFVAQLQNDIFEKTKQEFGTSFYEHWINPSHMGVLDSPSTVADLTGSCGDKIQMFLSIEKDVIQKARFQTTGCGPSIASAEAACELSEGRTLEEAAGMEGSDVIQVLGSLPEDKEHCAHLASRTVREAIRLYWRRSADNQS